MVVDREGDRIDDDVTLYLLAQSAPLSDQVLELFLEPDIWGKQAVDSPGGSIQSRTFGQTSIHRVAIHGTMRIRKRSALTSA